MPASDRIRQLCQQSLSKLVLTCAHTHVACEHDLPVYDIDRVFFLIPRAYAG